MLVELANTEKLKIDVAKIVHMSSISPLKKQIINM